MQKVVKLLVSNVEIVLKKEFSQLWNTYKASFVMIYLLEGIVWLNILDLLTNNFHNSKAFEDFDEERDEVTLDFCCKGSPRQTKRLYLPSKRHHFV